MGTVVPLSLQLPVIFPQRSAIAMSQNTSRKSLNKGREPVSQLRFSCRIGVGGCAFADFPNVSDTEKQPPFVCICYPVHYARIRFGLDHLGRDIRIEKEAAHNSTS